MKKTPLEKWIAGKLGTAPEPSSLRRYQLEKLRETLAYAKRGSRFYADKLRIIAPEDISSFEDVARLPFTYPADITACMQ